jgi:hypothetical protein
MGQASKKRTKVSSKRPQRAAARAKKPAKRAAGAKGAPKAAAATAASAKALAAVREPDRAAPPMAEIDGEALEFIAAIDRFKKQHGRPFPSWSEVLMIVRELGYRRA